MTVPDRDTALEQVAARLEMLEREMTALRQENATLRRTGQIPLDAHSATAGAAASKRTSRRGMLRTALGAAAATVGAGALLEQHAGTARADGTEGATTFSTNGSIAVTVQCMAPDGTGIEVAGPGTSESADYWGIASFVTNGIGVRSSSGTSTAVFGLSGSTDTNATAIIGTIVSNNPGGFSSAVRGVNNGTGGLGLGVWGSHAGSGWGGYFTSASGIGVNAAGGTGAGLNASGATGITASGSTIGVSSAGIRGGVFSGQAAQVQLVAGSAASHPTSGFAGDLYVDSAARIWFCKGGTIWLELTANAAVAIAAGWNLVGVAPAAAGLMASHVLSTLLTATTGKLAALYGLTNNQWSPSFIDQNGHTIGTDFPLVAGEGYLLYSDKKLTSFTLQAPVQVSGVAPGSHPAEPGQGGATLPAVTVLPGPR